MQKGFTPTIVIACIVFLLIAGYLFWSVFRDKTFTINQQVSQETAYQLHFSNGNILLDGSSQANSIQGTIKYTQTTPVLTLSGETLTLETNTGKQDGTIALPQNAKGKLEFLMVNGNVTLNLRTLGITETDLGLTNGNSTVIVPENHAIKLTIAQTNGNLTLKFPKKIDGVKLRFANGMNIPDFSSSSILEKTEYGYITKGYAEGNVNAEVAISGANLQLNIESID